MPGLAQLRQFSEHIQNLGGELDIRTKRGEPALSVPLPQGISEADDSDDFVLGIPAAENQNSTEGQPLPDTEEPPPDFDIFEDSDITEPVSEPEPEEPETDPELEKPEAEPEPEVNTETPENSTGFTVPETDDIFEGLEPDTENSFNADNAENVVDDLEGFDFPGGLNDTADFPEVPLDFAAEEEPQNFTEAEFALFKKNLAQYPLNLKIAIEELIVDDNYTNTVVFDIIRQVIKKITARQLANHLQKLIGISVSVPRDFEHRSIDWQQAYRQTLEYQLKNKIIPAVFVTLSAALVGFLLFSGIRYFLYQPIMAERLYKEGYTLLENGFYPQSEQMFDQALTYRPKKNWFFTYARGYRSKQQYERADLMYRNILMRYNHDKAAGLEYAEMELYDRGNFGRAEEIARREVLDYHINDSDGLLLLGDIALEWGTEEENPAKLEAARETYSTLIQLYGVKDTYLARMMRYFIRADNLREVLPLKDHFMAAKKMPLGGRDLVELSGFLVEKLFGYLSPADEYLRVQITNVRSLLEMALTAAPENPESYYNLGRYFVFTNNYSSAKSVLERALPVFAAVRNTNRRTLLHYINAHRLLGEICFEESEYILAEEFYRNGISIFEEEKAARSFSGNSDAGRLYADLGDLDYFISYDNDDALMNYQNAVDNQCDTPSVRYRIGYINYSKENYSNALGSFIKTMEILPEDEHLLLALGNVLAFRNDNYQAEAYYTILLDKLDLVRARYGIVYPQIQEDHAELVDTYMKAANNLGVVLYRQSLQTGGSGKNAKALMWLSESTRAWDALTRNQQTMVRLKGSNLAEQNISYITYPLASYNPELYTAIPRVLAGENIP
ncbi:MAG: hypothetical protein LBS97_07115 [Treponema sp.]|jgi:tetratricopeptide (TPR) repeat protein|nr:hypothetical protein [Treponema sp.]